MWTNDGEEYLLYCEDSDETKYYLCFSPRNENNFYVSEGKDNRGVIPFITERESNGWALKNPATGDYLKGGVGTKVELSGEKTTFQLIEDGSAKLIEIDTGEDSKKYLTVMGELKDDQDVDFESLQDMITARQKWIFVRNNDPELPLS